MDILKLAVTKRSGTHTIQWFTISSAFLYAVRLSQYWQQQKVHLLLQQFFKCTNLKMLNMGQVSWNKKTLFHCLMYVTDFMSG